jgi:hypothetical protein
VLSSLPLLVAVAVVACSFGFLVRPKRAFARWGHRAWLVGCIALVVSKLEYMDRLLIRATQSAMTHPDKMLRTSHMHIMHQHGYEMNCLTLMLVSSKV